MNDELKSSSLIVHHSASTSLLGLSGWGPKFQRPSESKDVKWGSQTIYSDFAGKNGTLFVVSGESARHWGRTKLEEP